MNHLGTMVRSKEKTPVHVYDYRCCGKFKPFFVLYGGFVNNVMPAQYLIVKSNHVNVL